jgi:predicted ATP-grasp superfamily ATP-dependent carboligase
MLAALVEDLAAAGHRVTVTTDPRFPLAAPPGVEKTPGTAGISAALDAHASFSDGIWLIAPETGGCLERLTTEAERRRLPVFGSGSAAISRASDKAALAALLRAHAIPHPRSRAVGPDDDIDQAADVVGYPLVAKPGRGAGSEGIALVGGRHALAAAVQGARAVDPEVPVLLQSFVAGVPASVALLAGAEQATALFASSQSFGSPAGFDYRGGTTPLDHPLTPGALENARAAVEAVGGLRGYVGVDVVLGPSEAVVVEVNPRLTAAWLGVRGAVDENIAALALAACAGLRQTVPVARRRVSFDAGGRILESTPIGVGVH